jgi:hypothetical protein
MRNRLKAPLQRAPPVRPKGRARLQRLDAPLLRAFPNLELAPKARGIGVSPGGAGVAADHKQATLVGEILDPQPK